MKALPAIAALMLAGGAFCAGYFIGDSKAAPTPSESAPTKSATLATSNEPGPPNHAAQKAEIAQLRDQLAQEAALREQLENEMTTLRKRQAAFEWIQAQMSEGNFYSMDKLQMSEDTFQTGKELEDFLGLSEQQRASLKTISTQFLGDIKAWEGEQAEFVDDFADGIRFELPAPPAEMSEAYLEQVSNVLDADDFAIFMQASKQARERFNQPRAVEAIVKEQHGRDHLTIKLLYWEKDQYVNRHSRTTTYQFSANSDFVKRWDHLLEVDE